MTLAQKLFKKIEETHPLYLLTILFCITILVYGNILFNDFVGDDTDQILNNAIIQRIENIPSLFLGSTFTSGGGGLSGFYYKPLMSVSFAINFALWGKHAFGFHLFSLFMHMINGFLIFFLFKKLFNLFHTNAFPKTIAFFLSFIFLVHPVNTESVAYIASTQELLYVSFLIVALLLTYLFCQRSRLSIKLLLLINFSFLLSLLSKESGIVTLPLVFTLGYIFSNRSRLLVLIPSMPAMFFAYLIWRYGIIGMPLSPDKTFTFTPIVKAPFYERLLTMPFELFSYFRLTFFPKDLLISHQTVVRSVNESLFYFTLPVIITVILSLIVIFLKTRAKLFLFFLLWMVFSFSILLNIFPLDATIAERWLYGPLIGILGCIGVLLAMRSYHDKKIIFYVAIAFIIIIPTFMFRTITRTSDWRSNASLFSKDIQYSADSYEIATGYGLVLLQQRKTKEAKKYFEESIQLAPDWPSPYNNLGVIYEQERNIREAKRLYSMAINKGGDWRPYENLAQLLLQAEKPITVIKFVKEVLPVFPNNEILNKVAALAYYKAKSYSLAASYAQRTYRINPSKENYALLEMINKRK